MISPDLDINRPAYGLYKIALKEKEKKNGFTDWRERGSLSSVLPLTVEFLQFDEASNEYDQTGTVIGVDEEASENWFFFPFCKAIDLNWKIIFVLLIQQFDAFPVFAVVKISFGLGYSHV